MIGKIRNSKANALQIITQLQSQIFKVCGKRKRERAS